MLNRILLLTLCLLLVAVTVSFLPAATSAPKVPIIVAQLALTNQTGPIPQTTIFTPTQSGVYRISTYFESNSPGTGESYTLTLVYADDVDSLDNAVLVYPSSNNYYGNPTGFSSFRALANNPVSIYTQGTAPQGYVYSLYITIERLM